MHVRTCTCCTPRVFNVHPVSTSIQSILLPAAFTLSSQATARIARSGHVPAIPAVETLDFSGVINSTRSYLTFLFPSLHLAIYPLPSCSPHQSLPRLGGTGARDSDLGFGFWCWNRKRHSLESRPNWYTCFSPLVLRLPVNLLLRVFVRIAQS